jgi:hypothetical protein
LPEQFGAKSRKIAAALSAASSPKRPNSSSASSTKDFLGTPPALSQSKLASFFQRNKSSAMPNT